MKWNEVKWREGKGSEVKRIRKKWGNRVFPGTGLECDSEVKWSEVKWSEGKRSEVNSKWGGNGVFPGTGIGMYKWSEVEWSEVKGREVKWIQSEKKFEYFQEQGLECDKWNEVKGFWSGEKSRIYRDKVRRVLSKTKRSEVKWSEVNLEYGGNRVIPRTGVGISITWSEIKWSEGNLKLD